MSKKRINLWSSPRNISTAMMYAFAQRTDTQVVDEPLYAHFLVQSDSRAAHPGEEEILRSMENDGKKVVEHLLYGTFPKPVIIFKQMTHHLVNIDLGFLTRMENVLLIRNPREILASYTKVIQKPSMADIGIEMQYELYQTLLPSGTLKAIVDARELLLDPAGVLRQLCEKLDMPFDANMLEWKAGARPEDGAWAKYWYDNVHRSTGFQKHVDKIIELPAEMEALAEQAMPFYKALYENALKHS